MQSLYISLVGACMIYLHAIPLSKGVISWWYAIQPHSALSWVELDFESARSRNIQPFHESAILTGIVIVGMVTQMMDEMVMTVEKQR